MQVMDLMCRDFTAVPSTASVQDAARLMAGAATDCLAVTEDGELIGSVSSHDLAVRVLAHGREASRSRVGDVLTPGVTYCRFDEEVDTAAALMRRKRLATLLVLDQHSQLVGTLFLGDLAPTPGATGRQAPAAAR
ncbi:MAG TPA: CBS domain-containing protein [Gammaproteobacteria bacterium]|nr:CBS domain-containing protein [Gammaproteobacteria bacterium]